MWDPILHVSLGNLAGVSGDAVRNDERRVLLSEAHSDVRRTYKKQKEETSRVQATEFNASSYSI